MRRAVPAQIVRRALMSLESALDHEINREKDPRKIAKDFNKIAVRELEKNRKYEGKNYTLATSFFGQYLIDKKDPSRLLRFDYIGKGCPIVPRDREVSIMARALATGQDQNIPNVSRDANHWQCSTEAKAEEVYVRYGLVEEGPFKGFYVAKGVIDIDFLQTNVLDKNESMQLSKIFAPYTKLIMPGPPKFEFDPEGNIYIMSPQEAKLRNIENVENGMAA